MQNDNIYDNISEIVAIKKQLDDISQKLDLQGEIQLELANILQRFHARFDDASQRSAEIITTIAETTEKQKKLLGEDVAGWLNQCCAFFGEKLDDLQQRTNVTLRRVQPVARKIRALFIIQSSEMWEALAPVYEAMVEDDRFDPVVASIQSSALGRGALSGEDDIHKWLTLCGIAHIRLDVAADAILDIVLNLAPDVVFRQQQWDQSISPALMARSLSFSRMCVVPYGMGMLAKPDAKDETDDILYLNYDQTYHRVAWKVFCETEITQSYYRSFAHSDPEKFIVSGYPKHDKLLESKGKGRWPIAEPKGRTYRVIWAPHHSLGKAGIGFGVFHLIFREMLAWAQTQQDIQFVFKPHPGLAQVVIENVNLEKAFKVFQQEWLSCPNCTFASGPYGDLFDASDLMLTDGVSFLAEYQLFEKPLIFFDSGVHQPFNALGRLAERAAHRVTRFDEMKKAVLAYKQGAPWPLEQERKDLLKVLQPNNTPAAGIILDSIANDIQFSRVSHV
jgi:CDP-Glycerol:Poly(glycerophosphate) glycerophosphotransferase